MKDYQVGITAPPFHYNVITNVLALFFETLKSFDLSFITFCKSSPLTIACVKSFCNVFNKPSLTNWYTRLAENNEISYANAIKLLDKKELKVKNVLRIC